MFISLVVVAFYLQEILWAPINTDAGFYLAVARLLQASSILYAEINMSYTPLGVSFFAVWGHIFGTNFSSYLSSIAFVQFLNSAVIFLISRQLGAKYATAWLASVVFLFLNYKYEGMCIVLEPFVIFWLLTATWALFSPKEGLIMPLLAGFCISMAILSKQYGLAYIPVLIIYLIWGNPKHKQVYGILGLILPWIACFIYFYLLGNLSPGDLWEIWMNNESYGERSIPKAMKAFLFFLLISIPHIFVLPFSKDLIAINKHQIKMLFRMTVLLMAFLGLGASLYIEQYPHYFQLIIPFGILLGVYMWAGIKNELKEWLSFLNTSFANKIVLLGLIFTLTVWGLRFVHAIPQLFRHDTNSRNTQLKQAEEVQQYVPQFSEVLLLSYYKQWLNYTNAYRPVLPVNYGYAFPENQKDHQLSQLIQAAKVVLTESYDLEKYPRYKLLLHQFGFKKEIETPLGIQVWKKDK